MGCGASTSTQEQPQERNEVYTENVPIIDVSSEKSVIEPEDAASVPSPGPGLLNVGGCLVCETYRRLGGFESGIVPTPSSKTRAFVYTVFDLCDSLAPHTTTRRKSSTTTDGHSDSASLSEQVLISHFSSATFPLPSMSGSDHSPGNPHNDDVSSHSDEGGTFEQREKELQELAEALHYQYRFVTAEQLRETGREHPGFAYVKVGTPPVNLAEMSGSDIDSTEEIQRGWRTESVAEISTEPGKFKESAMRAARCAKARWTALFDQDDDLHLEIGVSKRVVERINKWLDRGTAGSGVCPVCLLRDEAEGSICGACLRIPMVKSICHCTSPKNSGLRLRPHRSANCSFVTTNKLSSSQ